MPTNSPWNGWTIHPPGRDGPAIASAAGASRYLLIPGECPVMGSERWDLMKALGVRLRVLRAEAGLTGACVGLSDLGDPAIGRAVLDSLKLRLDGTAAAAETVRRKRRTLVNAVHHAVGLGEFKENPITAIRWKKPKVAGKPTLGWSPIASRLGLC